MVAILVCGGRDFADRAKLFTVLDILNEETHIHFLVHGGARGADALAGEWAKARKVLVAAHPADWKRYKAFAGPIRNREMLALHPEIKIVVAFPGGPGTRDMVSFAEKAGKIVMTVG